MLEKIIRILIEFVVGIFGIFAIYLVYKEIKDVGFLAIRKSLFQIPLLYLLTACLFIFCDYIAFSGYDLLALKYICKKLPYSKVIKVATIAFSVTNTTGHAYIAGGSIRYLSYSKLGLKEIDILKMIVLESLTFLMGMGVILDICLILSHFLKLDRIQKYRHLLDMGAIAITLAFLAYLYFIVKPKRSFKWHNIDIKAPTFSLTFQQILVGSFDIIFSSLAFYTLFRAYLDASYFQVAIIFLIAQIIGISSQVPGGLGVFEASFLYLYPHTHNEKSAVLSALISFRLLYYFTPLIITGLSLAIMQILAKIKPYSIKQPSPDQE